MWDWLRCCANCGFNWPPIDLFCERCWAEIFAQGSLQRRSEAEKIYHYWTWRAQEWKVGELIKKRKSVLLDRAHDRIASVILPAAFLRPDVVVYPTKSPGQKDHTSSWATAVARYYSVPAFEVHISGRSDYKRLSRVERQSLRKKDFVQPTDKYEGQRVLITDDVYTTGATIKAVRSALGAVRGIEVLVMAYKEYRRY